MDAVLVLALAVTLSAGACAQREEPKNTSSSTQAANAQPANAQPAAPSTGNSPAKAVNACEMVTPTEIAHFLNVPAVKKDDINSGKNEFSQVDICNWFVKEKSAEGLELRLYRAQSADEGASFLAYSAAKGNPPSTTARASAAQSVAGLGLDAILSPYPDGKGASRLFARPPERLR